ncbi:hypothetical protein ACFQ14_16980 [Pseudahrensia aquimaris]|uniref:DUF805 domain-containing protein n=1 Tax=Pseudahrensia aquimaris TaxID=744461 RepID=A0ABW3FJ10_9HYPH
MVKLLFSYRGTINRLPYLGGIALSAFLPIVVLILAFSSLGSVGYLAGGETGLVLAFIVVVTLVYGASFWVSFALIVKRTRAAFGGLTWFWVYLGALFLLIVPILNIFAILYMIGFGLALLFKQTKQGISTFDPGIFGGEPTRSISSRPESFDSDDDLGLSDLTDADLVARAAQLREAAAPAVAAPAARAAASTAKGGGFGQRGARVAFGQR